MKLLYTTIFLLSILYTNSWAALSQIQSVGTNCVSGASCALTVTSTGKNNAIFAILRSGATPTSVSDGTSNFTLVYNDPTSTFSSLWMLQKSNSGKTTITANYSPNANTSNLTIWEVSGFVWPILSNTATTSSGAQSGGSATLPSITTSSTNSFFIAYDKTNNTASAMTGAFTFDFQNNGNGFGHLISTTIGTKTAVFTDNGSSFTGLTFEFQEGGGHAMFRDLF